MGSLFCLHYKWLEVAILQSYIDLHKFPPSFVYLFHTTEVVCKVHVLRAVIVWLKLREIVTGRPGYVDYPVLSDYDKQVLGVE